jgi:hypothetical protein
VVSAILDETRTYRYRLTRPSLASFIRPMPVLWVMLNPSTADEVRNDPTIRKCRGFQWRWAGGSNGGDCHVVNLFALRATDPAQLRAHPDPIGPGNDVHIIDASREVVLAGGVVVVAWGAHPFARARARDVAQIFANDGISPRCLGTTKDGSPRHPLYVPYSQPLTPWQGYR